jgi:glutathione S-transferase
MLTIWGRANSVNVHKVLWCCEELDLPYERIDAGLHFGRNAEADYLAMNPNGRVPTLVDGDFVLWESNSIIRYLCMQYAPASTLYPSDPKQRASVDRWLDWALTTLQPAEVSIFWGYVRTPAAQRDLAALRTAALKVADVWRVVDAQLEGRDFLETDCFTLADIVLAAYARRWYGIEDENLERPVLPNVQRWYGAVSTRAGFQRYIAMPLT